VIRINKYLSVCGVTSRRGAEKLIQQQRVTINDQVAQIGAVINETSDVVKVDGTEISPVGQKVFVVLNKPAQVMTTLHDPFKRRTVRHFLRQMPQRVYPVGRLDYDTEGVLLLTNDGELAYRLTHPKYQIPRLYEAKVQGQFESADAEKIAAGITLDDGAVGRARVKMIHQGRNSSRIRLLLTEGRKREVKQLCKKVGHPVMKLVRLEFAGITTTGLERGQWRELTPAELRNLKSMVGLAPE